VAKLVRHHPAMTADEIAQELGCTVCEVKGALSRGLKKLRDGRAKVLMELTIARDKEVRHGLPKMPKERI
jgi:predicted transcriptional regulator